MKVAAHAEAGPFEEIISAAAALFARQGYRATTLNDVAAAIGVKKASVYHYIESKDELLIAIYSRIFDRIEKAVRPIAALDLSPDERLRRMIHAHVAIVAEERNMLTVSFQEEAELPEKHQRAIRRRKRAYEKLFEDVVDEGKNKGVFRDVDVGVAVKGLLGMCNWLHTWYRQEHGTPAEIAGEFALLFEAGLMTGPHERHGAWPRPSSVDEALEGVRDKAEGLAREVDQLRAELARAELRLIDGLAAQ